LKTTVRLIGKRKNQSAPGLDGITFPFLTLEKELAIRMILSMMRFIIPQNKIPNIWKIGKTTLIHKDGDVNHLRNWRPITLTSVLYLIIIWSIAQEIMINESSLIRDEILSNFQSGLFQRVNECENPLQ
jgi:hypothetical protein